MLVAQLLEQELLLLCKLCERCAGVVVVLQPVRL